MGSEGKELEASIGRVTVLSPKQVWGQNISVQIPALPLTPV